MTEPQLILERLGADTQRPGSARALGRRGFLAGLGGGAALLAAACGRTTPAASPGPGRREKVTLTLWTHDPLYVQFFNARAAEWAPTRSEYELTFEFSQQPSVIDKILAAFAAEADVPDLMGLEQGSFPRFIQATIAEDNLLDLTPLLGNDRRKFVEGSWSLYTHKGKIYGMESALSPVGYWYRQDLLTGTGIRLPLNSWSDFAAASRSLGAGKSLAPVPGFELMLWQRDSQLFDADGRLFLAERKPFETAIEVLSFLVQETRRGTFFRPGPGDSAINGINRGDVAGAVGADWYLDYTLKRQAPDLAGAWRLQPLPEATKGGRRTSASGGTGFAVYKKSKHARLTWELLRYGYGTKEGQVKRFLEIHYFPTMLEAIQDPRVTEAGDPYVGGQKIGGVFASVAKDVPLRWQSMFRNDAARLLNQRVNEAQDGKPPKEALSQAVDDIRALMAGAGR